MPRIIGPTWQWLNDSHDRMTRRVFSGRGEEGVTALVFRVKEGEGWLRVLWQIKRGGRNNGQRSEVSYFLIWLFAPWGGPDLEGGWTSRRLTSWYLFSRTSFGLALAQGWVVEASRCSQFRSLSHRGENLFCKLKNLLNFHHWKIRAVLSSMNLMFFHLEPSASFWFPE